MQAGPKPERQGPRFFRACGNQCRVALSVAWIEANANDGEMDIIWLHGTMPSALKRKDRLETSPLAAYLFMEETAFARFPAVVLFN
jgi:hypothetical protein